MVLFSCTCVEGSLTTTSLTFTVPDFKSFLASVRVSSVLLQINLSNLIVVILNPTNCHADEQCRHAEFISVSLT